MKKNILLMYISEDSGHHKASLAIERAFQLEGEGIKTRCVNSLLHTNPILEKIIGKMYMGLIKKKPEFWGYLYDNPRVVKKTQRLRESIHKLNTGKFKQLIDEFQPDAVVCTQAFPCGMVADYKKTCPSRLGLFGVLTDYAPHSYWIFDKVDAYFVPSVETGAKLIQNGVPYNKVIETGIPIDPVFKTAKEKSDILQKFGLESDKPTLLLMGGSLGLGPIKETFVSLLKTGPELQIIAVTGKNKALFRWFNRQTVRASRAGKKLLVFSYTDNVDELMEVATLIISKPGGITTAEACAKGLPLIIINPIPGQEQMNADYLTRNNVAIKVDNAADVGIMVEEILYNRSKLTELGMNARMFAKADSAQNIARFVLANI